MMVIAAIGPEARVDARGFARAVALPGAGCRLWRGSSSMTTKAKLIRARQVLTKHLQRPEFPREWERSALARAVAIAVVGYRAKRHLTQTQLAKRLGVRQPHIARLETGEHTPSMEMLQRLARALGLRFIVEVAPMRRGASKSKLTLPPGVELVEDVVAGGSRVRVATG